MGSRRKHLFVLLFVFGLIVVSALVIVSKPTQLGLDLKGGVQLVLQARPTPQQPTIDNGSMNRAIPPRRRVPSSSASRSRWTTRLGRASRAT